VFCQDAFSSAFCMHAYWPVTVCQQSWFFRSAKKMSSISSDCKKNEDARLWHWLSLIISKTS